MGVRAVENSGAAYTEAIARVEVVLPEIAQQVRDEIARGRPVQARKLESSDLAEREDRMKDAKAGKIGQTDVAVVGYSDDEQFRILLEAIENLGATMVESRRILVELDPEVIGPVVELASPEAGDDQESVDLKSELAAAQTARRVAAEALAPILEELRPT